MATLTKESLQSELGMAMKVSEIAGKYGTTIGRVYRLARGWGIPVSACRDEDEECPTPEEIATRTAEIRLKWSSQEEQSRIVGPYRQVKWRAPSFQRDDIMAAAQAVAQSRNI